jgi:hypothetical protein
MRVEKRAGLSVMLFICFSCRVLAQQEKQMNNNIHSWLGMYSTFRIQKHWGVNGDFLIRRNNFIQDPGFYQIRIGGGYWFNNTFSLTTAYSNLWLFQASDNGSFAKEYRFDQQLSTSNRINAVTLLTRFRTECRWRPIDNNGIRKYSFSERVRLLNGLTIPLSAKSNVPSIVVNGEILLQFRKQIVYNSLDQARLFTGIRQSIGKGFSFDGGYMIIYQQTNAGNVYNINHTIRLLFYYVRGSNRTSSKDLKALEEE